MTGRSRVWRFIDRAYVEVETALWAGLVAFLIFFGAAAWRIPEESAKVQAAEILAIASENHRYCEKWGKPEGTPDHEACVRDLQELRGSIERRFAESLAF